MGCEDREVSRGQEPQKLSKPQWAINRDLGNWLGVDLYAPRVDQRGYESDALQPLNSRVPANWQEGAELIGTFVDILDENGKIVGQRFKKASDDGE